MEARVPPRLPPGASPMPASLPIYLFHPVIPLFFEYKSGNINGLVLISFDPPRVRAEKRAGAAACARETGLFNFGGNFT